MNNERVDTPSAAKILGLKKGTLEVWRSMGRGPRFCRIGRRIFYRIEDLELFANPNLVDTIDSRQLRFYKK